jgi:hypothetical protein
LGNTTSVPIPPSEHLDVQPCMYMNFHNNEPLPLHCARKMATYSGPVDEGFDEIIDFLSMFPSDATHQLAGTKRDADNVNDFESSTDPGPARQGEGGHQVEHIDPSVLCCSTCCLEQHPRDAVASATARPSKRRASAQKVGEFHPSGAEEPSNLDHQFADTCFDEFCQESCSPCDSPCALPCEDTQCLKNDACFDPHCGPECDQGRECSDQCVDPDCTKLSCPDGPCFCQQCGAQPCPLGDPANECHLAHSAPDPTGTIYCYDNAPCHFQPESPYEHPGLTTYEQYPCFSQGTMSHCNVTAGPSSIATPTLSHHNYESLDRAFSAQSSSISGPPNPSSCKLNIPWDHCHIDNDCCHLPKRGCNDFPGAPQENFDIWKLSLKQKDGFNTSGVSYSNFGLQPIYPGGTLSMDLGSPAPSSATLTSGFSNSTVGFDESSWILPDSHFSPAFTSGPGNKLDFLASAVQDDTMKPEFYDSSNDTSGFITRPSTAVPADSACVCQWEHAPGLHCLQIFDSPASLHAHIKTSHVDNCTGCFCRWAGCDASTKDFKQRSKLSRHLLGHAGHRPYACSFEGCDKTFATNQAKDNHERTHTGEKPYVCKICGYTTTTHTQLQTHVSALHENKKPHKCRFCEFTCADSSNLSKHERTHQVFQIPFIVTSALF